MVKGPKGHDVMRQYQPGVKGVTKAHIKHMAKEWSAGRKGWEAMCWYCHKSSTTLPGIKLSACTKCRAVGVGYVGSSVGRYAR